MGIGGAARSPALHLLYTSIDEMAGGLDKARVRAGLRRTAQRTARLNSPDFRVPTLLIAGGEDVVFPPFLASAIAATLPCADAHLIPYAGHSPYFEQAATFNRAGGGVSCRSTANRRKRCRRTTRESPCWDSPSNAIASRRSAPLRTSRPTSTSAATSIVSEGPLERSITLPDLPGFFIEMDRSGPWTPVPLRVSQAQPGGPVEESFFKQLPGRDRLGPASRDCRSTRVFVSCPRRGAGRRHRRSRWRPVRNRSARVVGPDMPVVSVLRPARQRLAPHDRQPLGLRRLSREPAHRHPRARRRSRQAHARVPGRARRPRSPW